MITRLSIALPFRLSPTKPSTRNVALNLSRRAIVGSAPRCAIKSSRRYSYNAFETTSNFSPFVPPDPSSLPKPQPPKQYRRLITWGRRLLLLGGVAGTLYLADRCFNYSALTR